MAPTPLIKQWMVVRRVRVVGRRGSTGVGTDRDDVAPGLLAALLSSNRYAGAASIIMQAPRIRSSPSVAILSAIFSSASRSLRGANPSTAQGTSRR
jgi:hypothetical protein